MEESTLTEPLDYKEPLLSKIMKEELSVGDEALKEDPYQDEFKVKEEMLVEEGISQGAQDFGLTPSKDNRGSNWKYGCMDVERLISLVFEEKCLWDMHEKNYHNRDLKKRLWEDISDEMDITETQVRKKWKYLRDQFAVELGKIPPARSGDAAGDTPKSKWQYFKSLLFLKSVVKTRASTGNLSGGLNSDDTVETSLPESPIVEYQTGTRESLLATEEGALASSSHTNDTPEREDEVMEQQLLTAPSTRPKKKGTSKRSKTDDFNQSMLDIEQQKIQYLKENQNLKQDKDDEDLMFFKSLLSHVKRIPAVQKLTFRSQLQELVQQFAYPVTVISPLPDNHGSFSSASDCTPQMAPYSYAHSPIESELSATDMTFQPI